MSKSKIPLDVLELLCSHLSVQMHGSYIMIGLTLVDSLCGHSKPLMVENGLNSRV